MCRFIWICTGCTCTQHVYKGYILLQTLSPNANVDNKSKQSPSPDPRAQEYTPPTLNLTNSVFTKRVKSPRRLLLARRALLAKEKQDDVLSQRKSSSVNHRTSCQCFGKPQICSLCSSRFLHVLHLLQMKLVFYFKIFDLPTVGCLIISSLEVSLGISCRVHLFVSHNRF